MLAVLRALDTRVKRLDLGDRFVRRNPLYYGSIRRQIEGLQTSTLQERIDWTQERVRTVLAAARRTRYGERAGAPAELLRWPLLDKGPVQQDPKSFHAGGSWVAAPASTGGTTGTPLQLIRSPAAIVAEQICLDRMLQTLGADPVTARIAVLRADEIKDPSDDAPPFWKYAMGGRRLIFSSGHLSPRTLADYITELRSFRPDVLWVHPTMLEVLCRLLAQDAHSLVIPRVLVSSEMLLPEVWRLAQSVLGCSIVDYYGQAERVAFAFAAAPREYAFLPGYACVELHFHAQEESGALYEVIGTGLWNTAMPLVRYRTGDLIRVPRRCSDEELLEFAYGLRFFDGVIGRSRDVLLAPDGLSVIPGLSHIPRGVANLLRLQILQTHPARVIMRVLAAPGFGRGDARQLMLNARMKIPASVDVEIEVVDSLQRTARGKTPFVVHAPEVAHALRLVGLPARRE